MLRSLVFIAFMPVSQLCCSTPKQGKNKQTTTTMWPLPQTCCSWMTTESIRSETFVNQAMTLLEEKYFYL